MICKLRKELRYLRGTRNFGLYDSKSTLPSTIFLDGEIEKIVKTIIAYTDSHWAQKKGRKSLGGCVIIFMGAALIWQRSKHQVIALLSTEVGIYTFSDEAIVFRGYGSGTDIA